MIDLSRETLIPIGKAPSLIAGRPHLSTVWRWLGRGCRGVVLESAKVGVKTFTSVEAVQRFSNALTSASTGHSAPSATPRQREVSIARAEAELA